MWQGMDIIAAIELLGDHIFHVHAKDTVILPGIATRGVLDSSFGPVPDDPDVRVQTGMEHYCSSWPSDPAWRFVAIGNGHDVTWWTNFLRAIRDVNPGMNINIEHEDQSLAQLDGIAVSARNLLAAEQAV